MSSTPGPPPLISSPAPVALYLGDTISSSCLRRAQAYVDLITQPPPPPTSARHGGARREPSAVHPFRQVLDALAAARRQRCEAAAAALRRDDDRTARSDPSLSMEASGLGQDRGREASDTMSDATAATQLFSCHDTTDGGGGVQGASQARADLQDAFGAFAGAALHREWVLRPREYLRGVVRDIADTVVARLPHSLMPGLSLEEGADVHVQLLPSCISGSVSLPALSACLGLSHSPFCAVVAIREPQALALREEEQARLEGRLLSVAAPGQTVATSLRFWQDVSYGDTGSYEQGSDTQGPSTTAAAARVLREAGVENCLPLGLHSLVLGQLPQQPEVEEDGDMRGGSGPSKRARRDPLAQGFDKEGDDDVPTRKNTAKERRAAMVTVVPGTWSSVSQQFLKSFEDSSNGHSHTGGTALSRHLAREVKHTLFDRSSGCPWYQPDALITPAPGAASKTGGNGIATARRGGSDGQGRGVPSLGEGVRMGSCGLLAVLYLTVEGIAYVTYPVQGGAHHGRAPTLAVWKDETDLAAAPPPQAAQTTLPWISFPIEAKDSFTRSLLGL